MTTSRNQTNPDSLDLFKNLILRSEKNFELDHLYKRATDIINNFLVVLSSKKFNLCNLYNLYGVLRQSSRGSKCFTLTFKDTKLGKALNHRFIVKDNKKIYKHQDMAEPITEDMYICDFNVKSFKSYLASKNIYLINPYESTVDITYCKEEYIDDIIFYSEDTLQINIENILYSEDSSQINSENTPYSEDSSQINSENTPYGEDSSQIYILNTPYSEDISQINSEDTPNVCCICNNNKPQCIFLPCGHDVCCKTCGSLLNKCPKCFKSILYKL